MKSWVLIQIRKHMSLWFINIRRTSFVPLYKITKCQRAWLILVVFISAYWFVLWILLSIILLLSILCNIIISMMPLVNFIWLITYLRMYCLYLVVWKYTLLKQNDFGWQHFVLLSLKYLHLWKFSGIQFKSWLLNLHILKIYSLVTTIILGFLLI